MQIFGSDLNYLIFATAATDPNLIIYKHNDINL